MDLIELLLFVVLVVLSMLAGGKKKQPSSGGRPAARRPRTAPARGTTPGPRERGGVPAAEPGRTGPVPTRPGEPRTGAETLYELLRTAAERREQGEVEPVAGDRGSLTRWQESLEAVEAESGHGAVSLEEEPVVRSLETLEPAGEASHRRFHERYGIDAVSRAPSPSAGRRVVRPRGGLRDGVVWAELLGPPRGLRP